MEMQRVESGNVREIGYDAETETMRITFHNGRAYDYPNTSAHEHQALMASQSKGSHVARHFKHAPAKRLA